MVQNDQISRLPEEVKIDNYDEWLKIRLRVFVEKKDHRTSKATSCNLNKKIVFVFVVFVFDDKKYGHLSKLDRGTIPKLPVCSNLNPAKTDRPLVASTAI